MRRTQFKELLAFLRDGVGAWSAVLTPQKKCIYRDCEAIFLAEVSKPQTEVSRAPIDRVNMQTPHRNRVAAYQLQSSKRQKFLPIHRWPTFANNSIRVDVFFRVLCLCAHKINRQKRLRVRLGVNSNPRRQRRRQKKKT